MPPKVREDLGKCLKNEIHERMSDNSVQRIPLLAFNRIPAVALKTVPFQATHWYRLQ